jgi:hypothetical protein
VSVNTKISEGFHLVRLRGIGDEKYSVGIPRDLAAEAQMFPGGGLIAVRRIGPCIVLCVSHYATADDALRESTSKFEKAIAEWNAGKDTNGVRKK